MKKKIVAVLAAGAALTMAFGLAACNDKDKDEYVTVTYMDGTTVLKTEQVKKGEAPAGYTPTKDGGYEFVNWFATPSKNHIFDMSAAVNEDVRVYAGFTLFKNDTRDFYLVGSGESELLFTSNWGKVITDNHKLTKDANKNEYKITLDLKANDQFQFAINTEWANKRGFGYLSTLTLDDGTKVFDGEGSPYDDSAKGSNIKCLYSGNYTITLKTYPNEDYYNTSAPTYTEENKEIYNLGTYDKIEWVRNGNVVNDTITITDFYIKGKDITGWGDVFNPSTQMTNNGTSYAMSIYLKEDDEFMFQSRITKIKDGNAEYSKGADFIKAENLTDNAKNYLSGSSNMKAKASGIYTFTYDVATKKMDVSFENKAADAYDYYFDANVKKDGTANSKWGAFIDEPNAYRLAETAEGSGVYKISGVVLPKDAELLIRAYAKGATADWNTTHKDYQYLNMVSNAAFEQAAKDNYNIKVKTAGTYDIIFDSYTKLITIVDPNADPNDIYIKGGMNGWAHNFSADYRLTRNSTNKNLYEITLDFQAEWELGLAKYAAGANSGNGDWIGLDNLGTDGDANDKFKVASGNLKCNTAGKYKVVYNIETNKIDFYAVA